MKPLLALSLMCLTLASLAQGPIPSTSDQATANAVVEAVLQRCLARDVSVTDTGIELLKWRPPNGKDYDEITKLGPQAISPLAGYIDSHSEFEQLLAVRFLDLLGGSATIQPLKKAAAPRNWVVVRLSALEALWSTAKEENRSWVMQMRNDADPLVAKRVNELMASTAVR